MREQGFWWVLKKKTQEPGGAKARIKKSGGNTESRSAGFELLLEGSAAIYVTTCTSQIVTADKIKKKENTLGSRFLPGQIKGPR